MAHDVISTFAFRRAQWRKSVPTALALRYQPKSEGQNALRHVDFRQFVMLAQCCIVRDLKNFNDHGIHPDFWKEEVVIQAMSKFGVERVVHRVGKAPESTAL